MSNKIWVGIGSTFPRLELLVSPIEPVNGETAPAQARALHGLRIGVEYDPSDPANPGHFNRIPLREIALEKPFQLNDDKNLLIGLKPGLNASPAEPPEESNGESSSTPSEEQAPTPSEIHELIFEGLEGAIEKFLGLVSVWGWKLKLRQVDDVIDFTLILQIDWEFNSLPSYFPGFIAGEAVIGKEADKLHIEIAWPFSVTGKLYLHTPHWTGTRWRAYLDFSTIGNVLDSAGEALNSSTFGLINVSSLVDKIEEVGDVIDDYLYLTSGTDDDDKDYFSLEISTPESVEIAEFAGLQLWLIGRAAFEMRFTFDEKYIDLEFFIRLGSEVPSLDGAYTESVTGIELRGPIIRKIESLLSFAREAATLLPIEGVNDLPEVKFRYEFDFLEDYKELEVGKLRIPTVWDAAPVSLPALGFLKDLPMEIPPEALDSLENVRLGSLDGSSPSVKLDIIKATSQKVDGVIELSLEIDLGFKIFGEVIELKCFWTMAMDLERLAFDIGREIRVDVLTNEVTFAGLTITGLQTIEAEWASGGMILKAKNLKAYYTGLSEAGDTASGFELVVEHLLLDSGGLDLDAHLTGGTSKLNGIGDHFKGASGAIGIRRSEIEYAAFSATGPLPWMDNATGSLQIVFGRGFELTDVKAEFQLGLHTKTDWWIELGLERVNIDLDFSGPKPALLLKITGMIAFKPPPDSGATFLNYFEKLEVEFTDLVLTKSFDSLPPGIRLKVDLAEPKKVELFGIFGFEVRSIGFGSGFEPGEAALDLGGQVFFSAGDSVNTEADFHGLRIGSPPRGEWMPRISLEKLDVHVNIKNTLELFGSVSLVDTDDYKGFKGSGRLIINKSITVSVIMEFARVRRESDEKLLRMWMVYAELEDINTEVVYGFYLRDIGLGFGWRKTLRIMDEPHLLLSGDSSGEKIAPHHPESWVNDLEGEEANWTVVFSSWLTYGVKARHEATPLVGDIIIAFRSDLTFLASMRGWLFGKLSKLKENSLVRKPAIKGLLYYSARNKHIIAAYIVDPTAAAPEGVPPAVVQALIRNPFSFLFETRPGLFRIELGWPRQLSFPIGIYTGSAGLIFRKAPGSVTIGVSFEIAIDKRIEFGLNFGIAALHIRILIYIGIFGTILMRIGNRAALWGMVGINALIIIALSLRVGFVIKLGWFKINISFTISFQIILTLSAGVSFGISDAGFGMAGYATVGLRIWKFSFAASVSFEINRPALDEAYRRVFEGTSGLGDEPIEKKIIPLIPKTIVPLPSVLEETPAWRSFYIQKVENGETFVYVMMLPIEDAWFSNPETATYEEGETPTDIFTLQAAYDYQVKLELGNLELVNNDTGVTVQQENQETILSKIIDWNAVLAEKDESGNDVHLGNLFYEPNFIKEELRIIDRAIELHLPELIVDKRIRSDVNEKVAFDAGTRDDVRSPKFEKDTLYDNVMETAFSNEKGSDLSWEEVAVAHTNWCEKVAQKEAVLEMLFGDEYEDFPQQIPNDPIEADHWKKKLLQKIQVLKSSRSSLISRMLREFRSISTSSQPNTEILEKAGVFFKCKVVDDQIPIQLKINELTSYEYTTNGTPQFKTVNQEIQNATLEPEESGLGFAQNEFDYRIKDIIEFQDEEGMYFSWMLECRDADNVIHEMTAVEASGVADGIPEDDPFEYFDHYLIERINLSRNDGKVVSREVKPGFVPALQDMGAGVMKFFLLVPRFEFTDVLSEAKDADVQSEDQPTTVDTGDELLYRFVAVDVFGNRSQVTEMIAQRKDFTPPPGPAKVKAKYTVDFPEQSNPQETLVFQIEETDEAAQWESDLQYEIWTKSTPLFPGSYLGYGDTVSEYQEGSNDEALTVEGMNRLTSTGDLTIPVDENVVSQLNYGEAHYFYVRAISEEGNASGLVIVEVKITIQNQVNQLSKELELPYLERVPAYASNAVRWRKANEMRFEVLRAERPVYSMDLSDPVSYVSEPELEKRQLLLRFAHLQHTDNENQFLTGGYEIYRRDRDASIAETFENYDKVADLEVVPEFLFRNEPGTTETREQWVSTFYNPEQTSLAEKIISEDLDVEYDWGEVFPPLLPLEDEEFLPEGTQIHARLYEMLGQLREKLAAQGFEMSLTGGLPSQAAMIDHSFIKLQAAYNEETDPHGIELLKWMGRCVDVSWLKGQKPLALAQFIALLEDIIQQQPAFARYQLVVENLLAGDKASSMYFYRLSLWPVITTHEKADDNPDYHAISVSSFLDVVGTYAGQASENQLPGIQGKDEEVLAMMSIYTRNLPDQWNDTIHVGMTHVKDQGQYIRSVQQDGTILLGFDYAFEYARRFAFLIKQQSRYHYIYETLGMLESTVPTELTPVLVRFPRVKLPRPPAVQFLGNRKRGENFFSEWLLPEHEEETKSGMNETARNQLGFRGVAWSLFAQAKAGIMEGSGWIGDSNWYNLTENRFALLTTEERGIMKNAPDWQSEDPVAYADGLMGHPFEELLGPKGLIVRVPKLPYYYTYKMGAFARTDDVDSVVKLSDEVIAVPTVMPVIAEENCGWEYLENGKIAIWWKVPSVWESLNETEKKVWQNERPFASRLWDFDIQYNIVLTKNLTRIAQARVRAESVSADQPTEQLIHRQFEVQTTGNKLYLEESGIVEPPAFIQFASPFEPLVVLELNVDSQLLETIRREDFFAFELDCSRLYGEARQSVTKIYKRQRS